MKNRRVLSALSGVLLSSAVVIGTLTPSMASYAAPKVNPYGIVQAEFNFGKSGVEVVTEGDVHMWPALKQATM